LWGLIATHFILTIILKGFRQVVKTLNLCQKQSNLFESSTSPEKHIKMKTELKYTKTIMVMNEIESILENNQIKDCYKFMIIKQLIENWRIQNDKPN
jgi:hypothetical protein